MRQILLLFFLISPWLSGCAGEEARIIQKGAVSLPEGMPFKEEEAVEAGIPLAEIEIKTNPFLTPEEAEYFSQSEGKEVIEDFHLTAILYSPLRRRAIIDGRILGEGDSVDNKRIVQILGESVILKDEEGEYVLRLGEIRHNTR
ncbi:MAG: hypothetical protein ABIH40_05820 [Candidatus Omnitrophota bacterium]